ncbi:hypothetical protein EVJ58_g631 [Rhodofomes roseus]|uniref:Uncharacterized protein n=1 Tax=Rhodofomes roseus TaxID=34475 RepID=A0A4Y9Z5A4_9APHY|nr:hypothetical protein EVJ58_g631 [Rhodofomes roseus]
MGPRSAADVPAVVDERLASHDELTARFAAVESGPELPLPPAPGTSGIHITLRTNLLPTNFDAKTYFDYELKYEPAKSISGNRRAQVLALVEKHTAFANYAGQVAHDGSQRLLSVARLPDPFSIAVELAEQGKPDPQSITVEFVLKHELDMSLLRRQVYHPPLSVDAVFTSLVTQQHARHTGVRIGRDSETRFFFRSLTERAPISLGGGLEAWRGFFMSIRPTFNQVMTNVNPGMAPFYVPQNLAKAMFASMDENRGLVHPDFGRKLKVTTTYQGFENTWTIQRVLETTAQTTSFYHNKSEKTILVAEYFASTYPNMKLRHANNLPLVCVQEKPHPIHIPAELCEIRPGQPYYGLLVGSATTIILNESTKPPNVNAERIMNEGFQYLGLGEDTDTPAMNAFGVHVEHNMSVVPGRILQPPTPQYKGHSPSSFQPGSWNFARMQFQGNDNVFAGANDSSLRPFLRAFVDLCKKSGLSFPAADPPIIEARLPLNDDRYRNSAIQAIRTTLTNHVNSARPQPTFILVLLANEDSRIYCGLKRICDMELGVHTIGMQPTKATNPKGQGAYFGNVALKLNMKLGGVNHVLDAVSTKWLKDTMLKDTMLVGIDVTHGSMSSKAGSPSLAAIVASVDNNFTNYPAELRMQRPAETELKDMLVGRLKLYKQKNKKLPTQIIVYRDGLGESQYRQTILARELPSIRAAFSEVVPPGSETYSPKVTIVVCVKRHHTRFYPTETTHMSPNGNTLPGTVVDKGVGDPFLFEFYLQAHVGLQGTVKPTRYVVIYDEIGFSSDNLEKGTHMLCYLYPRATKAVSLVPPAYLADLACERTRDWLDTIMNTGDQLLDVSTGQGKGKRQRATEEEKSQVIDEAMKMWGGGVHQNLRETMFYI